MSDPIVTGARPQSWLKGLDGIRGIACVTVVSVHVIGFLVKSPDVDLPVSAWYIFGTQTLTMFFCLSGYLMYRPWAKATIKGSSAPDLRDYYTARALRVLPANVLIVVVAGLLVGVAITKIMFGDGIEVGRLTDPWTLLLNLSLLQGYSPHTVLTGLDASWSLVVEITFYATLPALGWLALRARKVFPPLAAALTPAILLMLVGTICRPWAYQLVLDEGGLGPSWATVFHRSILANCDLIGFGMAGAAIVAAVTAHPDTRFARQTPLVCWVVGGVGFLGFALNRQAVSMAPVMGLACISIIILLTEPRRGWATNQMTGILEFPLFRYLGEISYSLYLWHIPVILFIRQNIPSLRYSTLVDLVLLWLLVTAIAATLASLTYHVLEKPAMRYARTLAARRKQAASITARPAESMTPTVPALSD